MTSLAERQLREWREKVRALGREPEEWVGNTPDSMPPDRVRDRILRTWGNKCAASGLEIRPGMLWHADHIIPVSMGGMNAERNLQPLLDGPHEKKTKREAKERAKADAARRAGNGTRVAPTKKLVSAGFARVERKSNIAEHRIDKSVFPKFPPKWSQP